MKLSKLLIVLAIALFFTFSAVPAFARAVDCKQDPSDPACPPSVPVPEFGEIPGVIALVSSGVTYFLLKKRSNTK